MKSKQRVHFRLILMPCCQHLFCNVNPRLPSYCPQCGAYVFTNIREGIQVSDDEAVLETDYDKTT